MKRSFAIAASILIGCLSMAAAKVACADEPAGALTLEGALKRAAGQSPEVIAARFRTAAADAQVDQAYAGYLPTVSVVGEGFVGYIARPLLPGPPPVSVAGSETSASVGVSLRVPVYDFGRTAAQVRAAKKQREESEQDRTQTRDRVLRRVAELYLTVLADGDVTQAMETSAAQRAQEVAVVNAFVEHGVRPAQDLTRARLALTQAKLALATAAERQRADQSALLLVLGFEPSSAVELRRVGDDLLRVAENPDALVEQAVRASPVLQATRARAARFEAQADSASASLYPVLAVGGNASVAQVNVISGQGVSGTTQIAEARATLAWTAFDYSLIAAARASTNGKNAALAELSEQTREVRVEALRLASSVRAARTSLALSTQMVAEASSNVARTKFAYERGTSTYFELLDAYGVELNARMALVRARFDLDVAATRLLVATHTLRLVD
jgi:outer membrane protein TolC